MSEEMVKYELLVGEEDVWHDKINTCKIVIDAIIELLYKEANSLHTLTVEEIIVLIHRLELSFDTALLHLRLEKCKLAHQIDK